MKDITNELLAKAITEAVCAQFMDWLGEQKKEASLDLKADIYHQVKQVLDGGVEI